MPYQIVCDKCGKVIHTGEQAERIIILSLKFNTITPRKHKHIKRHIRKTKFRSFYQDICQECVNKLLK